jgi:tRNA A-37 threonylcarbamoyl transferase component Bud32
MNLHVCWCLAGLYSADSKVAGAHADSSRQTFRALRNPHRDWCGRDGRVYKARDMRLDRIVAIKVLPAHLADRAELRERFEREARSIASLNHPHICTLFDIGQQDGIDYLVLEYLEGETLAQRLVKGSLPLEQASQYAIEISDALDKAHRKGVTHRDLKPGNIMLTKTGTKLLDFGLAKLKQAVAPANVQLSQLPTAGDPLTAHGTIVGTLQYMAPEQLEGREVDARTDIFAFGAVVYEMATGKKLFEGKSQASLIAAILEREPPAMLSLQPMTPPAFDRLVKKCLAKEPEKRWQAASDVCDELKWIADHTSDAARATAAPALTGMAHHRTILLSMLGLCVLCVGIVVWNLMRGTQTPMRSSITRVVVALPPGDRLPLGRTPVVAMSPDGSRLVYVARHGGRAQLFLRFMDHFDATAIPGTEGAETPFFSPDGESVGFFAEGKLKKVSLSGGAPLTLCSAPSSRGASWGTDHTIIFTPTLTVSDMFAVSDAGGTPKSLIAPDRSKGEYSYRWPQILPGGEAAIYTIWTSTRFDDAQIGLVILKAGERRVLIEGGAYARYVPSGHLVYARSGGLLAVPFDLARLQVTGSPVSILEGVSMNPATGATDFSTAVDGSLAYVQGGWSVAESTLVWVNRKGVEEALPAPPRAYATPRLSPDGRRLAVAIEGTNPGAWVYELARGTLTELAPSVLVPSPIWTPDGKSLRMRFGENQSFTTASIPADGSGVAERMTTSEGFQLAASWSPSGKFLSFTEQSPSTGWDIWLLSLDGGRKERPFLQTPSNEGGAVFSPDGRWLAYQSDESGRDEVYVRPFLGSGSKWQISTEGGVEPVWARSGRELFYRNGDKMIAVAIETTPTFAAAKPTQLFEGHYEMGNYAFLQNYDVSPDGRRFLMVKAGDQAASAAQINIVLNWSEEIKRRVPLGTK